MVEGFLRFRFRDISILKKMIFILLVTFLIPLVLAGAIAAFYIGGRDAEFESRQDLASLSSIARELAELFTTAEEIAGLAEAKGLARNFAGKRESYRDYVSLSELADDTLRNVPLIKSIILFRNNRVIFERGPALDSDIPAYPEDLEKAFLAAGAPCWTLPRKMNFFSAGTDSLMLPLYRTMGNGGSLVLFTGIDAGELAAHYSAYSRGSFILLNEKGRALSVSEGDETRGAIFPGDSYPEELFRRFEGEQGFFRTPEKTLILYVKGFRNWYLVNHIEYDQYRNSQGGLYGIVLLATMLGICFASACLFIQRRYIFNPLKTMLKEMDQFQEGNLEAKMSYHAGDEIGRINREVEGIFSRLHDLIHEVYITRIYNQEATLKMFTSQINPHFLYNTLDSIRWKAIENGDQEVGEQIEALSDLFRHSLSKGDDLISVDQEISQLKTYLYIMNFRYRSRIHCAICAEEGIGGIRIPKLILQPLVENAIIHGIDKRAEPGEIRVSLEKRDGLLRITVSDNGAGTDPVSVRRLLLDTELSQSQGFALQNINRRIKLCYGDSYGMEFDSVPGQGTTVTLSMPVVEKERGT
jgi:two-component system sensor histidine kinase YesM